MTPSPEEREGDPLFARIDAATLGAWKAACPPFSQKDVLAALLRLFVEDRTIFNRVRREILDGGRRG